MTKPLKSLLLQITVAVELQDLHCIVCPTSKNIIENELLRYNNKTRLTSLA